MPISFNCPHCDASTQVADQYAGQSGPCKSCGNTIQIPPTAGRGKPVPAPSSSSVGGCILVAVLIALIGILTVGGALFIYGFRGVAVTRDTRMQCSNNLKQIALAMHNYHDVYKAFPPAYTVDENGNKLHSWRTLLLPFLEQDLMYRQIDFSKPWDAPENQIYADTRLPVFCCASEPNMQSPAAANYMVIVGPNTVFSGPEPVPIRDVLDGTANTLLVVEVENTTNRSWMEPTDLDFEQLQMMINQGSSGIASHHPGGAQVALADGSVRFLSATIDPQILRALITRDGGEVTPPGF